MFNFRYPFLQLLHSVNLYINFLTFCVQDYNSLIRREYCSSCRVKVQAEQNLLRQKKFRKKNKQEKKLLRNQNALLQEENRLLREMIVVLRDDVEQLKQRQV